jgi:catechol 2,3-dioxygenase-like lactoylglutathione lyase family enzyme
MPVSIRYIVNDVDAAVAFHTALLGFTVEMRPARAFRGDIVVGNGGKQVLLDDPSGNAIKLFEPPKPSAFGAPSAADR